MTQRPIANSDKVYISSCPSDFPGKGFGFSIYRTRSSNVWQSHITASTGSPAGIQTVYNCFAAVNKFSIINRSANQFHGLINSDSESAYSIDLHGIHLQQSHFTKSFPLALSSWNSGTNIAALQNVAVKQQV